MNYVITYQKYNGDIILRPRTSIYNIKIGDTTAMGWKVLNIHYNYEGNFYTYLDYCRVVRGHQARKKKKHRITKYLIKQLQKRV